MSVPNGTAQAQGAKPIQEPITGSEGLGELSQPQQVLAQLYRAFNSRDLKMIDDNFAACDDVAIDDPLGEIRRGADEPHKMYDGGCMIQGILTMGRPCLSVRRSLRFPAPAPQFTSPTTSGGIG